MDIVLIIFGLTMIIIGIICLSMNVSRSAFLLGTIGAYILSGGIMMHGESYKPKAMDVYQGKTTLEITYKDGVAIDSVVVFKNKKK